MPKDMLNEKKDEEFIFQVLNSDERRLLLIRLRTRGRIETVLGVILTLGGLGLAFLGCSTLPSVLFSLGFGIILLQAAFYRDAQIKMVKLFEKCAPVDQKLEWPPQKDKVFPAGNETNQTKA